MEVGNIKYIDLILKNPFRNKTRSALSIIGIAIGITTIVALGLITGGLEDSIQTTMNSGGAEITVSGAIDENSGQTINIDESYVNELKNISGVNDTGGVISIGDGSSAASNMHERRELQKSNAITLNGLESSKLSLAGISDVNGSIYADGSDEAIIGKTMAEKHNKTIGDTISVDGHEFKITGIFETGSTMKDNGAYASLSTVKEISNRTYLNEILVKTNEGVNNSELSDTIENNYDKNLTTTTAEEQAEMMNHITDMLDTSSLAISLLAIIIGGIGIINTMIMVVYERTKEIGVLRAVGWKSKKILLMILGETLVLTILSAIVGIIFGIAMCEIGVMIVGDSRMLSLAYTPNTFILAFGVAIIVGIIGGIYPAYRASKLEPTEALRYE